MLPPDRQGPLFYSGEVYVASKEGIVNDHEIEKLKVYYPKNYILHLNKFIIILFQTQHSLEAILKQCIYSGCKLRKMEATNQE